VIDEIMADPTPQVNLPNNEWIELRNTSKSAINLLGWKLGDAAGESGPMPNLILLPDSFVIVCAGAAVQAMAAFGTTIGVTNFPSLDNTADQLFLESPQGSMIHSVSYTDSWYRNELKKEGDAREFVNRIQSIRKESGFNLTDRIIVKVSANEGLQASFNEYKTYICAEILADSLEFLPEINDGNAIEINESIVNVNVIKKGN